MKVDFRVLESKARSNLWLEASSFGRLIAARVRGNFTTVQSRFREEWAKQISAVKGSRIVPCRGLLKEYGAEQVWARDSESFGGELWVG